MVDKEIPSLDASAAALTILTYSVAGPKRPANIDPMIGSAFSSAAQPSSSITAEFNPVESTCSRKLPRRIPSSMYGREIGAYSAHTDAIFSAFVTALLVR